MLKSKMTRRTFLKASAITGVVAASASYVGRGNISDASSIQDAEKIPNLCNGCSSRCGMTVTVSDGRVVRVDGNPLHSRSRGTLCGRAHGAALLAYHPDRLTEPLKKNENGEFEPISWEQAYKEIGEKLQTIINEHGPDSFAYFQNPKRVQRLYGDRFVEALGSANIFSHNASCNLSRDTGFKHVLGGVPSGDVANAKVTLFIGRSYGDGIRPSQLQNLVTAKDNGSKIYIVDPRLNSTSNLADEWLPIKPGTDLALLLAIANVLIEENLYDKEFCEEHGNRFEDFEREMKQYTPEWASDKTDLSVDVIKQVARDLGENRPKAIVEQSWKGAFGCNYENSTETARMVGLVNALLGNINVDGGMLFTSGPSLESPDNLKEPGELKPRVDGAGIKGEKWYLADTAKGVGNAVPDFVKEGKLKAAFCQHHNPVRNHPDYEVMKEGYEGLDLLVVVDIWMSETAEVADYVLPESSWLERTEAVEGLGGKTPTVNLRVQAIDKIHPKTKNFSEIMSELADEMGLSDYFTDLETENRTACEKLGISYDELLEQGTIQLESTWEPGYQGSNTESGKVEFACQAFEDAGFTAVPKWVEPKVTIPEGEFRLIHGKQNIHSHTYSTNIPKLAQISKEYNLDSVWINKKRADELGIKDGDPVIIENEMHTGKTTAKVTEAIHPEAAFYPSHYGSRASLTYNDDNGLSINDYTPHQYEAMSGAPNMMETSVQIKKDGA
ncbi:molybdopterin-containing oxidoreductase family protein [Texcoconibacillus texcoconensis]|uniref:Thiosulfate reductase/polysulfide reductase chain A n=1 Tax=Texcoconibacillus texcoconensis TaxID=1095777 RepID=A0A840QQG5_9BACI|nr:molybdopterin-dependent oxidoreductase [Texcoconibacillus texcoconensis]MBB5173614.1 thiosulfate reductase/polysulfide reductase chain A [Texcoconibacillus texcoconensis]